MSCLDHLLTIIGLNCRKLTLRKPHSKVKATEIIIKFPPLETVQSYGSPKLTQRFGNPARKVLKRIIKNFDKYKNTLKLLSFLEEEKKPWLTWLVVLSLLEYIINNLTKSCINCYSLNGVVFTKLFLSQESCSVAIQYGHLIAKRLFIKADTLSRNCDHETAWILKKYFSITIKALLPDFDLQRTHIPNLLRQMLSVALLEKYKTLHFSSF